MSDGQRDKAAVPDWVQYVIGAIVSIVLVVGYLQLSSDNEGASDSKAPVTEDDTGD